MAQPHATPKKSRQSAIATVPADYVAVLNSLKARVRQAQAKAMLSVNRELIQLYWDIGREIVRQQDRDGWGRSIVERLADDIQKAFPGMGGFSRSNVFRMRAFFQAYRGSSAIVPQLVGQISRGKKVAQPVRQLKRVKKVARPVRQLVDEAPPEPVILLPWGHNVLLFEKIKEQEERLWYAVKALEQGWSRSILAVQIESGLCRRQGTAITNFSGRLAAPQSDLAQQSLKDPYLFDFLTLHEDAAERDLEQGLVGHIQKFLLELGAGFAGRAESSSSTTGVALQRSSSTRRSTKTNWLQSWRQWPNAGCRSSEGTDACLTDTPGTRIAAGFDSSGVNSELQQILP